MFPMRPAILAMTIMLAGTPAFAQSTPPTQSTTGTVLGDIADIVFKEAERRAIEEYYEKVPGTKRDDDDKKDDDDGKYERSDKDKHKDKKHKKAEGNGRGHGLPPGLAKHDQLPPGLAKRGNRLPHGLMKSDLPPALESKLPPLPDNVERVAIDSDILLIEKGANMILDVIEGVLINQ